VAESLTGGRIGHLLTRVPGASDFLDRVIVTYSNRSKVAELGVPWPLIRRHGAVSAEVAEAMARGVRRAAGTHLGLATTGIAGPTGATATKPVGLVYIAVSIGRRARVERHLFHGPRARVQQRAALAALNALRLELDHA
jgi:nicotinamide-nucleotide amidase